MKFRKLEMHELGRVPAEKPEESKKIPVVVVLDNVRSFNNVGSVFRTCDAFSVAAIHLCGLTPAPPHREIQKTALGATETVPWKKMASTLESVELLRKSGYRVYAAEQTENSTDLDMLRIDKSEKYALVFGHEVYGVEQDILELCDGVIEIPQGGSKHSLNISVSAGVVLWEFFRKHHEK